MKWSAPYQTAFLAIMSKNLLFADADGRFLLFLCTWNNLVIILRLEMKKVTFKGSFLVKKVCCQSEIT